jgi:hypothetical protein
MLRSVNSVVIVLRILAVNRYKYLARDVDIFEAEAHNWRLHACSPKNIYSVVT